MGLNRLGKLTAFCVLSTLLSACSETEQNPASQQTEPEAITLHFCLYAYDNAETLAKKYLPFLDYLEAQLQQQHPNLTIDFQGHPSYRAAINAMASGHCDFMRSGPVSYILAKKRNPNIQLLAKELVKGKTRFKGIIAVNQHLSIYSLHDLKGIHFAFGDPNSTIGRYLSQAELVQVGIHKTDFKHFAYLENHDAVARAVKQGEFHAGALKESTYKKYQPHLRAIYSFDNVTKPWMAKGDLDTQVFKHLQAILLNLKDEKMLKVLKKSGFTTAKDADYDFVRKKMRQARDF